MRLRKIPCGLVELDAWRLVTRVPMVSLLYPLSNKLRDHNQIRQFAIDTGLLERLHMFLLFQILIWVQETQ